MGVVNRIDHIDECFQTDRIIQNYTDRRQEPVQRLRKLEVHPPVRLGSRGQGQDHLRGRRCQGALQRRQGGPLLARPTRPPAHGTASGTTIRPGTDLAVALAMINMIVNENLYNKVFRGQATRISPTTNRRSARTLPQYTPEWAETSAAFPAARFRRIAREFAGSGASIAPAHKKTLCANYANATQLVHCHLDPQHPGRHG